MQAVPAKWILPEQTLPPDLGSAAGSIPPILLYLLEQRGIEGQADVERFLNPRLKDLSDPFLIPEMDQGVDRVFEAVDRGEHICIFGDYDVDGITSIALTRRILQAYGAKPRHFVPIRSSEGYGLTAAALERCMSEGPKPGLLLTVDCGTASCEDIARLRADGIDVVVIDHHEPGPDGRPDCNAFVNPKSPAASEDFSYLCAAGVAFKLAHAMLKRRPLPEFDLRGLLELVALATIADIVPLVGENRTLVRNGLRRLSDTVNPGLRALQEIAGLNGHTTSMDVGFRLGPRINAAGRMDKPQDALETLLTDCRRLAAELAARLERYNKERQNHEMQIRKQAAAQLEEQEFDPANDPVIVLGARGWHPGVVGIVASRMMRRYHKPSFVIAIDDDGLGKGSGRSIAGVSLVEAINHCRDLLDAGGGHDMAAGISIPEQHLDEFRKRFGEFVLANTTEEQRAPTLRLDAELTLEQLNLAFLAGYEKLQPFGNGNPQPMFYVRGIHLARPPVHLRNAHLRLHLRQGLHEHEAVFFGGGERNLPDPPWDMAFTIDRNNFRGRTNLQVIVQDIRAAE
jgi:single-stranded-DNA-specific exonuclease